MVCDDSDRNVCLRSAALIFNAGYSDDFIEDRLDRVDIENRARILHDAGESFEAETGVDIRMRQRRIGAVLMSVELGEYEVPELNVSVAFAARLAVR